MLNIPPQLTHRGIIVHRLNLPCLRGFSWFFSAWESCGRAAKRWKHESRNFGLESHFHADVRVRIWPSGLDWLIFLQTRKSIWLVRLIDNTEETVGISVRVRKWSQDRKWSPNWTANDPGPEMIPILDCKWYRSKNKEWHGFISEERENMYKNYELKNMF